LAIQFKSSFIHVASLENPKDREHNIISLLKVVISFSDFLCPILPKLQNVGRGWHGAEKILTRCLLAKME
jgi:hypothetical protein